MFVSNPFAGAFGLDIGDLSLKLTQLYFQHLPFRPPRFYLRDIRELTMPPGYIVNGEIQQPEMVRRKLLRLLGKDGHFKPVGSNWVVADLPEPKTFLKLITVAGPAAELLPDDVLYQARKHLPFEIEETYLDWQVVNEHANPAGTELLVGAVPKVVADSYTYLLESAGLNVLALEIEGISIARTLITKSKDYTGEARGILDLGATRSSLIIYDHGTIQLSTNFNFSGELITTALSQELRLDYETAEKMKLEYGVTLAANHPKYLKIISPLVDQLAADIAKTLNFYRDHFPAPNPITHFTMCGGLANLKNLDVVLAGKFKISARPGNAWKNLSPDAVSPAESARGLTLVSALGLAMRAAKDPLTPTLL